MADHIQNPNSPLRTPEGFAAEFGLPFKKKKRRWNVTEDGFARVSAAGKGDHRRDDTPERGPGRAARLAVLAWRVRRRQDGVRTNGQTHNLRPDGT